MAKMKRYPEEFKLRAAKLVVEQGHTCRTNADIQAPGT